LHPLSSDKNGGTKNGVASPLCKGNFGRSEPAIITDIRGLIAEDVDPINFGVIPLKSLTPETYRENVVDAKDGPRTPQKIETNQIPISTKEKTDFRNFSTKNTHPSQAFNHKMVHKHPRPSF